MRKRLHFSAIFCIVSAVLIAGNPQSARKLKTFSLAAGGTLSAVDFTKGDDALKKGIFFRAVFPCSPVIRLSAEYGFNLPYQLGPTWLGVKSRDFDFNVHYVASVQGVKTSFYAITGLNVKTWSAQFTGINKEAFFPVKTLPGETFTRGTLGANLGFGFERKINDLGLLADVRFRAAPNSSNVKVRIVDVAYSIGLKYDLVWLKKNHRKSLRMPDNIYDLH